MTEPKILFPNLPDRIRGLGELAENLWWSWNPRARQLFKTLDRQAWKDSGHNPDKMLRELPATYLNAATDDEEFLREYDVVMRRFQTYLEKSESPHLKDGCRGDTSRIVYFSAEYGLHRSLPFYAGGLGFLAGDHLKECSDLFVPLTAVGFMYPGGYLRQRIRDDGWQENLEQPFDREAAAISRVLGEDGTQLVVQVPLMDPPIYVGLWKVSVGRVPLYLMDTDIEQNAPWNRGISARLYFGDQELRLRQEIVLGIGGAAVLKALGVRDYLLHLNEGHAAFSLLERLREHLQGGADLSDAMARVRATTLFTTHTPIPAGHDVFAFEMMERYFRTYWPALGLDREGFMQLGTHPDEPTRGFNMTAFALRSAVFGNAVSQRHAEVTRQMWHSLWPDRPPQEVPIESVTNGVHLPTWIEPKIQLLFDRHLGPTWLEDHDQPEVWELLEKIPDEELWKTHYWLKVKLIDAIRERARLLWSQGETSTSIVLTGGALLDPSVLTIGFARRFATYKRADLILHDLERLKRLVNDRWRPVQFIFAGKAHPADDPGKRILQRLIQAAQDPSLGGRLAFVENYGEQLGQYMVHGVDVWLNNPLPPMEASGTSGMKAALNGVPHLSISDGWWAEGFNGKNGWLFEHKEQDGDRDRADAESIYALVEDNVIPTYYKMSSDGVPHDWVRMMRESIKGCGAPFSSRRMVKEYITKFYAKRP